MTLIQLQDIAKSYGGTSVFRCLDWSIEERARIGLVGPNGAGKSTLLRIMDGTEEIDDGLIARRRNLTTAYLPQHVGEDERTPVQIVVQSRSDIAAAEAELTEVTSRLGDPALATDLVRMERLLAHQERALERLDKLGVAGLEGEARAKLIELGLAPSDLTKSLTQLSGGQRKMVLLVACLIRRPDLLLLDEPETHLDLRARSHIESFIRAFDGAVVIVSHDRYLLDETVTEIAQLDAGKLTLWQGSYSTYALEREIALKRQEVVYVTQQKEITRLEEAIRRFRQWASEMPDSADNSRHIKQARNKERQIESMDKIDRPVLERRKIKLSLHEQHRSGQKVVELSNIQLTMGGRLLLQVPKIEVRRGERAGVIGPNGAGKTLLARVATGGLDPTRGSVWRGPSVRLGYFAQDQATLPAGSTAIDLVRLTRPMRDDEAVSHLMKFLFTYDQVRRPVEKLSGGERSRLQLLLLMLSQANFLVLDEPTNHLDIESMEVLEQALEEFEGTVLVISHDRYFLDRIVDRTIEMSAGRPRRTQAVTANGRRVERSRVSRTQ
jgi:ATP-binding cassette, subfamily F, member 3